MILAREPHARDGYRLLTAAARLVQRLHDDALAPLGLTRAAVIALEAVAPRPMYQEQLAAKSSCPKPDARPRPCPAGGREGWSRGRETPTIGANFRSRLPTPANAALQAASQAERAAVPADFDGWEALSEQLARFVDFFQTPRPGTRLHDRNSRLHVPSPAPKTASGANELASRGWMPLGLPRPAPTASRRFHCSSDRQGASKTEGR